MTLYVITLGFCLGKHCLESVTVNLWKSGSSILKTALFWKLLAQSFRITLMTVNGWKIVRIFITYFLFYYLPLKPPNIIKFLCCRWLLSIALLMQLRCGVILFLFGFFEDLGRHFLFLKLSSTRKSYNLLIT